MKVGSCALLALLVTLLSSCASLPENYPRTASTSSADYASTTIGAYFEKASAKHPNQSGFAIVSDGRRAVNARIVETHKAENTLDLP